MRRLSSIPSFAYCSSPHVHTHPKSSEVPSTDLRASNHACSTSSLLENCFSAPSRASHTSADWGILDVYFRASFNIFSGLAAPAFDGEIRSRIWAEHSDGESLSWRASDCRDD